jgi:hypothetical protein
MPRPGPTSHYLSLNPFVESGQLGAIAATETLYPGRSPASDVVREVVGSDEAEKVAFYLAKRDAQLADNYLHKTKLVKFVNKTIDRGTVGLATVAYFIGSLPLLVLFGRKGTVPSMAPCVGGNPRPHAGAARDQALPWW